MPSQLSVSESRAHSRGVFDRCQTAYRMWVNSGSAYLHREDELFAAFSEMMEIGKEYRSLSEKPEDLWAVQYRLALALEPLRAAVLSSTEVGIVPPANLWREWDKLEEYYLSIQRQKARSLESLEELSRMAGITDSQIADMYGWHTENGAPDVERVIAEKRLPVADRRTPPNPQQRRFDEEHAARVAKVNHCRQLRTTRLRVMTEPAPEAWETLFDQGISAAQIADMKRCSIDQVFAEADARGIPRPALDYHGGRVSPVEHAEGFTELPSGIAELDADDQGSGGDDDPVASAQIAEAKGYLAGGYSPVEIARLMQLDESQVAQLLNGQGLAQEPPPQRRGRGRPPKAKA